jgi:hypothetical protein
MVIDSALEVLLVSIPRKQQACTSRHWRNRTGEHSDANTMTVDTDERAMAEYTYMRHSFHVALRPHTEFQARLKHIYCFYFLEISGVTQIVLLCCVPVMRCVCVVVVKPLITAFFTDPNIWITGLILYKKKRQWVKVQSPRLLTLGTHIRRFLPFLEIILHIPFQNSLSYYSETFGDLYFPKHALLLHAGSLSSLLRDLEDGGDVVLQISVYFHWAMRLYIPDDRTLY